MQAQAFINKLLVPEDGEFQQSWSQFFLAYDLVQEVVNNIQPDQAQQLLGAGQAYSGGGWTTSKAAKAVFELTQVSLVTSDFSMYRGAFLFSLALPLGIEVPELNLTDKAAEAAFSLATVFGNTAAPHLAQAGQDENTEEEEPVSLAWDEPVKPLPQDFQLIWQGVRCGERRLDIKNLLLSIPRYAGLPEQGPLNNHRKDGRSKVDSNCRAWQQVVLHSVRLLKRLYTG